MTIRRPEGCTCVFDGDRLIKRCDQCESDLRAITKHVRPKAPRHGQKIVAAVVDHVPRSMTWHVIECQCGWSSALHLTKAEARTAYDRHRKRDNRKKAA